MNYQSIPVADSKLNKVFAATKNMLLVAAISTASSPALAGGDAFQPVWVDSLKVCASNSGKTARQAYTISAGPDRVFVPDTIKFVRHSATGHKTGIWFHEEQYEMLSIDVDVADHTYQMAMPRTIIVEPFAETGSGHPFNVCAFNNGYIHAETIEISR